MKEILQKFSPEISSQLMQYPPRPQKVFDLHGYYESEISGKLNFIWDFSQYHHYSRIKIITGKGKQVLFSEVKRVLTRKKQQKSLHHFKYDEGSFDVFF